MTMLRSLHFLVHGFCYAEAVSANPALEDDESFRRYWRREKDCAERWREGVRGLDEDAALLIVPFTYRGSEASSEFEQWAGSLLGDRCLVLDYARPCEPPFWQNVDEALAAGIVTDLQDALLGQGQEWNKEELDTALQCRGCAGQFWQLLSERQLHLDVGTVSAEAWGASFEGCVTKYAANLRRLLGLSKALEIDFSKTVPDARFLLDATWLGRFEVEADLRLFLWSVADQPVGLFVRTSESLADGPVRVKVPLDPDAVTVLGKQGGRLWPPPTEDKTPPRGVGYYEPPQDLVTECDGQLTVPANHGMVWRLAKSPAYIFGEPGTEVEAFRELLLAARRA